MRYTTLAAVLILGTALAFGCKKEEKKPAAETPTEPETPPETPPEPETPDEPEAPTMANKMANCPSAVEGAKTSIADGEGAVVVTIAHDDAARVAEIKKRAKHLESVDDVEAAEIEHSGEGTGGGDLGKCPVVMGATTLAIAENDKGVDITITPKDASKLADVKKDAETRLASMHAGHDGHGHGSGTGGGGGEGEGEGDGEDEDEM